MSTPMMRPKAMPTQRQRNGFRPSARGVRGYGIARANVRPTRAAYQTMVVTAKS